MCGVIGLMSNNQVIYEIIDGLISIQHRGQDAAGAITYDQDRFHLKKGKKLVTEVFNEKNIKRLNGNVGLGHVRYPTIGSGSGEDAQPLYINSPYGIAIVHNGNVANYNDLKKELLNSKRHINSSSDVEIILNIFAKTLWEFDEINKETIFKSAKSVMEKVKGGYSVVGYIAQHGMFAFKDPNGLKPLFLATKGNNVLFASETVVSDALNYKFECEIKPGEVYWIKEGKSNLKERISNKIIFSKPYSPCIFEWVYFSRPDSIINNISVYNARYQMGYKIAEEIKKENIDADVVIPVPDTARTAALAISEKLNIPFKEGLIKNRYIGRTFIMPDSSIRDKSLNLKLNPIISEIKGKNIILVDDSIVRGITSKKIINLVRTSGAKKIFFISTSPPIKHTCVYGIDMQIKKELIAFEKTISEIKDEIGADKLFYLSVEGLIEALNCAKSKCSNNNIEYCTACFTGIYPGNITTEDILTIENKRIKDKN